MRRVEDQCVRVDVWEPQIARPLVKSAKLFLTKALQSIRVAFTATIWLNLWVFKPLPMV